MAGGKWGREGRHLCLGALGADGSSPWAVVVVGHLTQVERLRHPECSTRCSTWHTVSSNPEGTLTPLSQDANEEQAGSSLRAPGCECPVLLLPGTGSSSHRSWLREDPQAFLYCLVYLSSSRCLSCSWVPGPELSAGGVEVGDSPYL